MGRQTLSEFLDRYSETAPLALSVAAAVDAIAAACIEISRLVGDGALSDISGAASGKNADGDAQKDLDVVADEIIRRALRSVPIAAFASEEAAEPERRDSASRLCVAVDPLDGSSNIDLNMTVGTIFSITVTPDVSCDVFRHKGAEQVAAGFVAYGPQTTLVLALGDGVDVFTLDRAEAAFKIVRRKIQIPTDAPEFAINASNHRHWDAPVRTFIDECLAGADGPHSEDLNMRWIGSLVAEAYRILTRGGVFLYPADARAGYANGRLRMVYEAHPMAFIIEQAGGAASTGRARILDLASETLHQRVPLIMGSIDKVRRIEQLYASPEATTKKNSPLFEHRGFFRV